MKLVDDKGRTIECLAVRPNAMGALSRERTTILHLLAERPMDASEMARRLGSDVQALYYHIKILRQAGWVRFAEYEERHGGMAKKLAIAADGLAVVLNKNAWRHAVPVQRKPPKLFAPFIRNNMFHGKLVVGSPDPHGKYRARASELGVLELAMLLGQYAAFRFPLYALDTQLNESDKKQNLIVAGGPKVNVVTAAINSALPLRFDAATFEIFSTFSKKRYTGNIGVIERVHNPFGRSRNILLVGGLNHHGTRAAVLAMVERMDALEEGNRYRPGTLARVVEGFDENGDGTVDSVEVLE